MSVLVPCARCARHVKEHEASCPFCGAAVTRPIRARVAPTARDRAALMFGAATLASAVTAAACNTAAYGGPPVPIQVDRVPVASDAGYDAALSDAAQVDASVPYQPEAIVALYGMVPADVDAQAPPRRADAGPAPKPKK